MTVAPADYFKEANLGFAQAEPADLEVVRRDMALEQAWLTGESRYSTNEDVETAFQTGELVLVGPTQFYRPIKRLLIESGNTSIFQPYLKPGAAKALDLITGRAHDYLRRFGVASEVRYAVTSLVRSLERQDELSSEQGKLALPSYESGHPTGWDFDIDSSGYYVREDSEWKSVSRRNPERQKQLNHAHLRALGAIAAPTLIAAPSRYDSRIRLALHYAAAEFYSKSVAVPVVEYANTSNELIHFGVNPNVVE